ncbi:MAG: polymerase [Clostridia bacterium]|jgi:DNA polymerase V|nr:polymerase [Clostridia bacterium]MDN5322353.1 polymerase [Clostridia bacterium]
MFDYSKLPRHNVLCIDMKSFYASCECVFRKLDPLNSYLAVIGDKTFSGSIVLSATPKMKKDYGIKTGSRLFAIPRDSKIHLAEARMALYLNQSLQINRLLNEFVPLEAIHTYSVDEFWICIDGTEKLFGDRWMVAKKIRQSILDRFRLPSCIGIGPNKFLAKVILDIEAKQTGIAECQYEDVSQKLWPQPVEQIWGIGHRMKKNLNQLGILTLGHLAHYPLEKLKKRFGVMGEQLHWHAWGVDLSPVTGYNPASYQKGFGHGITLLRDYKNIGEIKTVILELCEEVARRAREAGMAGRTISLGLKYSHTNSGGGFFRSYTKKEPTNITMEIYEVCLNLFARNYRGETVRQVHLYLTNLSLDRAIQLNLFEDKVKNHKLGYVVDEVRAKYGSTALLRAQSYTQGGIMLDRAKKIGGHKAL